MKATVPYVLALESSKHRPYGILVVAQVSPIPVSYTHLTLPTIRA